MRKSVISLQMLIIEIKFAIFNCNKIGKTIKKKILITK